MTFRKPVNEHTFYLMGKSVLKYNVDVPTMSYPYDPKGFYHRSLRINSQQ